MQFLVTIQCSIIVLWKASSIHIYMQSTIAMCIGKYLKNTYPNDMNAFVTYASLVQTSAKCPCSNEDGDGEKERGNESCRWFSDEN